MTMHGADQRHGSLLKPRLGVASTVSLVVGGMVGVGIFVNPSVAASTLQSPFLDVAAWLVGGMIAILGAFVYGELAAHMPGTGGDYLYLKKSLGPFPAFLFGWTTFLVVQAGSLAAASIIFARSLNVLVGNRLNDNTVVVILMATLAIINCGGLHIGNLAQLVLGLMKCLILGAIILTGLTAFSNHSTNFVYTGKLTELDIPVDTLRGFAAAMIPILFTFGGWQTANYMGGEINNSPQTLSKSLIIGAAIVVVLYSLINLAFLNAFGLRGLGHTREPTSDLLLWRFGAAGQKIAAVAVAISALGFLSQSIMTGPRIYFAMAKEGFFFKQAAQINAATGTPVVAILMQVTWATMLAISNNYRELLSYVIAVNFLFYALSASTIFIIRGGKHDKCNSTVLKMSKIPFHPWTTLIFISACLAIVASAIFTSPWNSLKGLGIMALGVLPFLYWNRRAKHQLTIREE